MTGPNQLSARTVSDVLAFRDERGWRKFHNPKDLAISLSLEASELLECFQWSGADTEVPEKRAAMSEELADVLIYGYPAASCEGTLERYDALKAAGRAERASELAAADSKADGRSEGK